ncbi:hypothetical protein [Halobacteriovorax sp. HLS]|uniref:hypothetical protein n=1 Tax=Halobacteriovorax sp. HLS TaxID=2234000 RepID=UPI000FD6E0FA|nr:hypothetical protein [Halobacteriovorax sp. HLS]
MKYLFFIALLIITSCGPNEIFAPSQPVAEVSKTAPTDTSYKAPSSLVIDSHTITNEFELNEIPFSSSLIQDMSKVQVDENSYYMQKRNTLFQFSYVKDFRIKMSGGKIVQDTSNSTNNLVLGNSIFKVQSIDLTTGKVTHSQIFDNHFNGNSFLPTKDGEYWTIISMDLDEHISIIVYKKMSVSTNCPFKKTTCSSETGDYAIGVLNANVRDLSYFASFKGSFNRAFYNRASVYLHSVKNNSLNLSKFGLASKLLTSQSVPLHANAKDRLGKVLFHKDSFYVSGLWSDNKSENLLELMKFDLDLSENPSIAFDNATSGPDGNIDVVGGDKYVMSIARLSSMNDDLLFVTSEYSMSENKRFYDTYLVDSNSGELASYFNGKKPLQRPFVENELFFNDDNHIYYLSNDNNGLSLESVNKGGVSSLVNGAQTARINFDRKFVKPKIKFFNIVNGVASIIIHDEGKNYLKRFNIH